MGAVDALGEQRRELVVLGHLRALVPSSSSDCTKGGLSRTLTRKSVVLAESVPPWPTGALPGPGMSEVAVVAVGSAFETKWSYWMLDCATRWEPGPDGHRRCARQPRATPGEDGRREGPWTAARDQG